MNLKWLECRNHMLDLNRPIRFEPPTFLPMACKAVHSAQTYFSLSFSPRPLEKFNSWVDLTYGKPLQIIYLHAFY